MIKVLKETPTTVNGVDCLELLVKDDCMPFDCVCDNCCYRYWDGNQETGADCCTVHGCTSDPNTYFELTDL